MTFLVSHNALQARCYYFLWRMNVDKSGSILTSITGVVSISVSEYSY